MKRNAVCLYPNTDEHAKELSEEWSKDHVVAIFSNGTGGTTAPAPCDFFRHRQRVGYYREAAEAALRVAYPRLRKVHHAPDIGPELQIRRRESINNLAGGELGFVAVYFNACGYTSLHRNFARFLKKWEWMGDRLLIVELAFDGQEFQWTGQAENLLQLRSNSILWHKEGLINAGTKILRERGFENVGWLDGDTEIVGDGEAWYKATCEELKFTRLVQPFEYCKHEFSDGFNGEFGCVAEALKPNQPLLECYKTGLAWAVHGKIWDKCGWFDYSILGSGDRLAYVAALPVKKCPAAEKIMQFRGDSMKCYLNEWKKWAKPWRRAIGNHIGFVKGFTMRAHPHGTRKNRRYYSREIRMQELGFNPQVDVRRDENGLLRWTELVNPGLIKFIGEYLQERKEDG